MLDFLSRSLPLETPRQTWVYTEGRNILGLVAVKNRPGTGAWEIDRLLGGDCPNAEDVLTRLLVHLSGIGGEDGVQKIFLRLPADSPWVTVARRAGFFAYAAERVYQVDARPPISAQNALLLRPRRPQDHLALFEHYNRVTPARVRQAEALTLQEWRWMDGWQPRRHFRFNLARGRRDYVWEEDGHVVGWLRFEARSRALRVTLDPEKSGGASADAALAFAVRSFQTPGVLFAPVRDYQPQWESALIRHGFSLAEEYTLLVRQLAVRVGEHCLVPVGV